MKTGGGVPKFVPIEGPEKDLLVVLDTQLRGMPSKNDCDFGLLNTDITGISKEKRDQPVFDTPNGEMVADEMECLESSHEYLEMNSPNQMTENTIVEVVENEMNSGQDTEKTSSDANWSKWNPDLLKTKKKECAYY